MIWRQETGQNIRYHQPKIQNRNIRKQVKDIVIQLKINLTIGIHMIENMMIIKKDCIKAIVIIVDMTEIIEIMTNIKAIDIKIKGVKVEIIIIVKSIIKIININPNTINIKVIKIKIIIKIVMF